MNDCNCLVQFTDGAGQHSPGCRSITPKMVTDQDMFVDMLKYYGKLREVAEYRKYFDRDTRDSCVREARITFDLIANYVKRLRDERDKLEAAIGSTVPTIIRCWMSSPDCHELDREIANRVLSRVTDAMVNWPRNNESQP